MARATTQKVIASTDTICAKTLVLDNGAHSIKAGLVAHGDSQEDGQDSCHVIPNVVARSARDKITYVGSQMDSCEDYGELVFRRPVEKGYIVGWEMQKAIWESSILYSPDQSLASDPTETNLVLTEPSHAPTALQRNADEMVFEEFGFANYYRALGMILLL